MDYDLQYLLGPECRKKVLKTAIKLYSRPSSEAPGFREIACASDVPVAVVKRHFPCQDDLRREVLEWFFNEKFIQSFSEACERRVLSKQTLSELDTLMLFFETCEVMISRYSCIFHEDLAQIRNLKDRNERATYFSKVLAKFSAPFNDLIRKGQERGFFTQKFDSQKMTYILRHFLQGAVIECLFFEESSEPSFFFDRIRKEAQEIFCGQNLDWRILSE